MPGTPGKAQGEARHIDSPSSATVDTGVLTVATDGSAEASEGSEGVDCEQASFASSHGRRYPPYEASVVDRSYGRNVESPYSTGSLLTTSSEEDEEDEEGLVTVADKGGEHPYVVGTTPAVPVKGRGAAGSFAPSTMTITSAPPALKESRSGGTAKSASEASSINSNEEEDDTEDDEDGVIAIGLPAIAMPAYSRLGSIQEEKQEEEDEDSKPPPPPRTVEEANQRLVSSVVAQNLAEQEHHTKTGEKERLASVLQSGSVRVVARTPLRATGRLVGGGNAAATASTVPAKPPMDEFTRIKNRERELLASAVAAGTMVQASSSSTWVPRLSAPSASIAPPLPSQKPSPTDPDEALKREIQRGMMAQGNSAAAGSPTAAVAAMMTAAAERTRLEQVKGGGTKGVAFLVGGSAAVAAAAAGGPSVAPAVALPGLGDAKMAPAANTAPDAATAAAAYATARFRQELAKMITQDGNAESGPSLATAVVGGVRSVDPAAQKAMMQEQDNGPRLAPAVDTALSSTSEPAAAAAATTTSTDLEAGLPILPGAFAVEGIEAPNRRRSGVDDDGVLRTESFEDERSVGSADRRGLLDNTDDVEYAVDAMVVPDALEAELQLVVDGAVILPEEDEHVGAKAVKKLRVMQASTLCFALAAVAIVVGIVVGARGMPKLEPLGWTQVGSDILGPKEQPQVLFGQSVAVTDDGSRVAAAAPGMDLDRELNVGEVLVMNTSLTTNGTSDWIESGKMVGEEPSLLAKSSLAMSRDGRVLVTGRPNSGNSGLVLTFRVQFGNWEPLNPANLIPLVADNSTSANVSIWFGHAVSLAADGSVLAVGAPMMSGIDADSNELLRSGGAFCYRLVQDQWQEMGSLQGENANELLGWSVALQETGGGGFRLAVGGPSHDAERGIVRIYDYGSNDEWSRIATLEGTSQLIRFGESLAFSQDASVLAVGARGNVLDAGSVHIYRLVDENWTEDERQLRGQEHAEGYGAAVSLSAEGDVLAVGAPQSSEAGLNAGRVEVYKYDETKGLWALEGKYIPGSTGEEFGSSVALGMQGRRLVVGAPSTTFDGSIAQAGAVRVFDRDL
jgi:hypothetical protein